MVSYRRERLNDLLKSTIAEILQRDTKDPRIGFTTVTHVKVSRDLRNAKIYFSNLGNADENKLAFEALQHAKSFIQYEAGHKLQLKFTPKLEFFLDNNLEYSFQLEKIFNKISANKKKNDSYVEIASVISSYERIFISTHKNPEGDAIGSALALLCELEKKEHKVRFSLDDEIPHPLDLLPYASRAEINISPEDDELVIIVDCPNLARISSPFASLERRKAVINIDHHLENDYFAQYNSVDSEACATGELVYFLLQEMTETLETDTAILLYTAILTDTGSFRFANTNKNAFFISNELMEIGLNPHHVAQIVYENFSISKLKLLGHTLSTMEISDDGKVSWITITQNDLSKYQCKNNSAEGFVNYPRYIEGVIVSVFFHETEPNVVKISLRSKGNANVAEFAKKWGGGGHKNAAACLLEGDIKTVSRKILDSLIPLMSKTGLNNDR